MKQAPKAKAVTSESAERTRERDSPVLCCISTTSTCDPHVQSQCAASADAGPKPRGTGAWLEKADYGGEIPHYAHKQLTHFLHMIHISSSNDPIDIYIFQSLPSH